MTNANIINIANITYNKHEQLSDIHYIHTKATHPLYNWSELSILHRDS